MGTSALDLMGGTPTQKPDTTNVSSSALDMLNQSQSQPTISANDRDIGFWGKLGNVVSKASDIFTGTFPGSPGRQLVDNIIKANQDGQAAQALGSAASQVFSTTGLHNIADQTVDAVKGAFTAIKDDPTHVITSMPSALVDMANAPLKMLAGVDFTADNSDPLTVEQRAQSIKDTGGLIAMSLVGAGVSKLLATGSDAAKLVDAFSKGGESAVGPNLLTNVLKDAPKSYEVKLLNKTVANITPKNILTIKNLGKGFIEGAAAGTAGGLVSGAGDDKQIENAVTQGLMFAPLGAVAHAFTQTKPELKFAENAQELATNIQNYRQLRVDYNDSIKSIDTKASSIISSNDMADAVLKNNLAIDPKKPTVIAGVDKSKFDNLDPNLPYQIYTHDVGKGKVDALIVHENSIVGSNDLSMFNRTGHYQNEIVSYKGKPYTIDYIPTQSDLTARDVQLRGTDGNIETAKINKLQRNSIGTDVVDPRDVMENQYQTWKNTALEDANKEIAGKTIESGSIPDISKISDLITSDPFKDLPNNKRMVFGQLLGKDLEANMDPLTKVILERYKLQSTPSLGTFEDFESNANNNGYKIQIGDGGSIIFRDMGDPQQRIITTVNNIKEGNDFIIRSGQGMGNQILPLFATPSAFDGVGSPRNLLRPEPYGKFNSVSDWADKYLNLSSFMAHWATQPDQFFKSVDAMLGTEFHPMLYDRTQAAKQAVISGAKPYIKRLGSIMDTYFKNASLEDMYRVGDYQQAASPEELIKNGFSRPINDAEQQYARSLNNSESLSQAFRLRAFIRDNPEGNLDAFKQEAGITPEASAYNSMFDLITKNPKDDVDLGKITALARKLNLQREGGLHNAMSRTDFAKTNEMLPKHIAGAEALIKLSQDLATEFKIPQDDMLNYWMTHARLYYNGDMSTSSNLYARNPNPEAQAFYAKLQRTGEIDAYERNPVEAMKRYIMGGFNALHYNDVEAAAQKYMGDALENISNKLEDGRPTGAIRDKIQMASERYMDDLRGRTPIMSQASIQAANIMLDKMGTDANIRDRTGQFLKASFLGTQGAKIAAGVRDFMVINGWLFSRFGPEVHAGVLEKTLKAYEENHPLIRSGKVQGSSLDQISDPGIGAEENFLKRLDAGKSKVIDDWMMKLSGQEVVYNSFKEGAYSYMYEKAAKALRKIASGDLKPEEALKQLDLHKNAAPTVQNEFLRQLKEQSPVNYDAVAEYLARDFSRQVTPNYGLGNNPTGWSRTVGRLVSAYGSWPMWMIGNMKEGLSTGSLGDRFGRVARFGLYTGAVAAAGAATGYDFSPWNIHPAFSGGPVINTALDVWKSMQPDSPETRAARDRLQNLSPIDMQGNIHKQFWIPGSFEMSNLYNTVETGDPMRMIGIKPENP